MILLHSSPQDGSFVINPLLKLASNFTLIALDTPGYGLSEPLSIKWPNADDYAYAVIETLNELKINSFYLYGTHTGAHIALEVANIASERTIALVLDGISFNTVEEKADLLENYAPGFEPDPAGAYLAWAWQHTRDQLLFYPWFCKTKSHRLRQDMAGPKYLHDVVVAKLLAGDGYRKGYRAAFSHDTLSSMSSLQVSTTIIAREGEILSHQVGRLHKVKHNVRVIKPSNKTSSWLSSIRKALGSVTAEVSEVSRIEQPVESFYLGEHGKQRFVQFMNADGKERPLVMLHGEIETSTAFNSVALRMAQHRPVLLLDIAGNGRSDPLPKQVELNDFVADTLEVLEQIGLQNYDLMTRGCGASLALAMSSMTLNSVSSIVFDTPVFDVGEDKIVVADKIAPEFLPTSGGGHLIEAWHVLRDRQMFWPWFCRTSDGVRAIEPAIDPKDLHRQLMGLMQGRATYGDYARALVGIGATKFPKRLGGRALLLGLTGDRIEPSRNRISKFFSRAEKLERPFKDDLLVQTIDKFLT